MRVIALLVEISCRIWRHVGMMVRRPLFRAHGRNFTFDPEGVYSYRTITVGNDVSLGLRPILLATRSGIRIGNNVMFGPEVTIRGGNHRIDMVGRFMNTVTDSEKRPEDDPGVVIEDDVWVGTRAIILAGVTIGRGSVIGAGAVVTRSVPPYAIAVGTPARVVRFRWDADTIRAHETVLYPEEMRMPIEQLVASQAAWQASRNEEVT